MQGWSTGRPFLPQVGWSAAAHRPRIAETSVALAPSSLLQPGPLRGHRMAGATAVLASSAAWSGGRREREGAGRAGLQGRFFFLQLCCASRLWLPNVVGQTHLAQLRDKPCSGGSAAGLYESEDAAPYAGSPAPPSIRHSSLEPAQRAAPQNTRPRAGVGARPPSALVAAPAVLLLPLLHVHPPARSPPQFLSLSY